MVGKKRKKRKRGALVMKELIPCFSYELLYVHSILREATFEHTLFLSIKCINIDLMSCYIVFN